MLFGYSSYLHHPLKQFSSINNEGSVNYTNFENSLPAKDDTEDNCVKNDQGSTNDCGNSNDCVSSSDSDSSKNSSQKDHVRSKSQNDCAFDIRCPHFLDHSLPSFNEHSLSSGKCPQSQAHLCYFHMPVFFPYAMNCCNYLCSNHKNEKENNSHPHEGKDNITDDGPANVTSTIKETCVAQNYHLIKNSWHYPLYCSGMPYAYVPFVPVFVPSNFCCKQNCVPSPEFNNNFDHVSENPEKNPTSSPSETSVISTVSSEIPDNSLRHSSCSNNCTIVEKDEFQKCDEKKNEKIPVYIKEKLCNKTSLDNEQINCNRQEVKYRYKSKIPRIIKSGFPNLKDKKTSQNTVNNNCNNVVNEIENIYVNNLSNDEIVICNTPRKLIDKYRHNVTLPIIELNKEKSNNEIQWAVYQSEMHHESMSLNMLNIENKITKDTKNTQENSNNIKNVTDKYIGDDTSDNKYQTLNYKIEHCSRSGINNQMFVDNSKIHEDERINKERLFYRDVSPSPEIKLDQMTLQLLLNNQDDSKDIGEKNDLETNDKMYHDNTNNENTPVDHKDSAFPRIDLNNNFPKKVPVCEMGRIRNSEDLRNEPASSIDRPTNLCRKAGGRPLELYQNPELLKGINSLKSLGFYSAQEKISSDTAMENENKNLKQSFPLEISLDDLSSTSAKFIVSFLTGQHAAKLDSKGDKGQNENMDTYIHNFLNNKVRNIENN